MHKNCYIMNTPRTSESGIFCCNTILLPSGPAGRLLSPISRVAIFELKDDLELPGLCGRAARSHTIVLPSESLQHFESRQVFKNTVRPKPFLFSHRKPSMPVFCITYVQHGLERFLQLHYGFHFQTPEALGSAHLEHISRLFSRHI